MFHNELRKGRILIEGLSAHYFVMHENLYLETDERGSNIHKFQLNQLLEMGGFQLYSTTVYHDKHNMIEIIARARRIVYHKLSIRIGFSERVNIPFRNSNDLERDLDEDL